MNTCSSITRHSNEGKDTGMAENDMALSFLAREDGNLKLMIFLAWILVFPGLSRGGEISAIQMAGGYGQFLRNEEDVDLFCLRCAYPEIVGFITDARGDKWVELDNGARVLYAGKKSALDGLNTDLRQSMAQSYPLEPARPDTPQGFAPGRKRPYALFEALYGADASAVKSKLDSVKLGGKSISLSREAANALAKAIPSLESYAGSNPSMRPLLKADGGFFWRKIAGENNLSAHSWGIAFDIGASRAPYWRWSKAMPHPMQKSYPSEIVKILEDAGFIWGGKWHEYDLMHFEYRPEIICKAKLLTSKADIEANFFPAKGHKNY